MGTIKATNIEPIADNGTVTLGSSGDTFSLGSGVLQSNMLYPAFKATMSADQSITESATVLVAFNEEVFDTDNAFNNTANGNGYSFTVPSGKGGKYVIYTGGTISGGSASQLEFTQLSIFVNGSVDLAGRAYWDFRNNEGLTASPYRNTVLDLSADDYVQVYFRAGTADSSSPDILYGSGSRRDTFFGGYRIGT